MAKTFEQLGSNVVRPEPTDGAPKTEDAIIPSVSERGRRRFQEQTGHEMAEKNFTVWAIRARTRYYDPSVPDDTLLREELNGAGDQRTNGERFITVSTFPDHELRHILPNAFPGYDHVSPNLIPDLVVLYGGEGYVDSEPEGDLGRAYLAAEIQPIKDIRTAADNVLFHRFSDGTIIDVDWSDEFFNLHLLPEASTLDRKKQPVTREGVLALLAAELFRDDDSSARAAMAFDEFARSRDDATLRKMVTPGRIKSALERIGKSTERRARDIYQYRKRHYRDDGGFADEADYRAQWGDVIALLLSVTESTTPEQLQEEIATALIGISASRTDEYLADTERDAAERRLIQPLIVAVGPSERFRSMALEHGADAVFPELDTGDMKQLITLANRIRTSPASVAAERLRRNKAEFYRLVVNQIEQRSETTADTEKELLILATLFEKSGAKKILDVGCGYGRLALPLARKGFDVTGLDASRTFLEKARTEKGSRRNLHYKKGDIIDYRDAVEKESYDAVYYGWHSFLEAYGLGNALSSLRSARHALRPGGILVFDQPARENPGLEDGWYGDEEHGYLAYLMDENELRFLLTAAGFADIHIAHWATKPSAEYPEGMKKVSVAARKPVITGNETR